jgi:hypothetical protein
MLKWVQLLHPQQQQQQPQPQNREGAKQVKITVRLLDILLRILRLVVGAKINFRSDITRLLIEWHIFE